MDYLDLNPRLTTEQQNLKKSVRQFARDVLRPAARELDKLSPEEVKESNLYWDTLRQARKLDYHTPYIPENHDGMGLSPLELQIFWEEIAWGSAGFALTLAVDTMPSTMAALIDDDFFNEHVIAPFVRDKEARIIGCWPLTEPDHGSDWIMLCSGEEGEIPTGNLLVAEDQGDHWLINGTKAAWVSNGPVATQGLLFARLLKNSRDTGKGILICPLDLPGVSRGRPLDKIGQRELLQGELYFDNVKLPREYMLYDETLFDNMAETVLAHANAGMSAMFTGVARAAFEEALAYARQRKQGGKYLWEHQNVKNKLFQMFKDIEAARALSRSVMGYNMNVMPPATRYSMAAKVFSTDTAFRVAHEAITIFGGSGLSREYFPEKLFRDARAGLIADGSNDVLGLAAINHVLREYT